MKAIFSKPGLQKILIGAFLLGGASSSIVWAETVYETADYTLFGGCKERDGKHYGDENFDSNFATLHNAARTGLSSRTTPINGGLFLYGRGSGDSGCQFFIDLMNCTSLYGAFTIDDGKRIFGDGPAVIESFKCLQK